MFIVVDGENGHGTDVGRENSERLGKEPHYVGNMENKSLNGSDIQSFKSQIGESERVNHNNGILGNGNENNDLMSQSFSILNEEEDGDKYVPLPKSSNLSENDEEIAKSLPVFKNNKESDDSNVPLPSSTYLGGGGDDERNAESLPVLQDDNEESGDSKIPIPPSSYQKYSSNRYIEAYYLMHLPPVSKDDDDLTPLPLSDYEIASLQSNHSLLVTSKSDREMDIYSVSNQSKQIYSISSNNNVVPPSQQQPPPPTLQQQPTSLPQQQQQQQQQQHLNAIERNENDEGLINIPPPPSLSMQVSLSPPLSTNIINSGCIDNSGLLNIPISLPTQEEESSFSSPSHEEELSQPTTSDDNNEDNLNTQLSDVSISIKRKKEKFANKIDYILPMIKHHILKRV